MRMIEQALPYVFSAGLVVAAVGAIALIVVAFRTRLAWGIGLLLFPPLFLVFPARYPRKSLWPATVLLVGLVMVAGPALYTRYAPVDLGPHLQVVGHEVRITLTGWDRTDYNSLRRFPDAVVIQMANPDVDDQVLAFLEGMARLRELDLSHTKITSAGLRRLGSLPALETLRLRDTQLDDAGLHAGVVPIESLKRLDVTGTQVTAEALKAWSELRPGRRGIR